MMQVNGLGMVTARTEQRYQGSWDLAVVGDYCWFLPLKKKDNGT
jgi:hypothetical protein